MWKFDDRLNLTNNLQKNVFVPLWILYKTNHEHDFKYEKRARQKCFQIKDLDTRSNFCENNVYPESIKNDNGSVAMRKKYMVQTEPTNPSN